MFRKSRYAVLNKIDLLPHLDFDVALAMANARRVNPALQFFLTSARTGEGLDPWFAFLRSAVRVPADFDHDGDTDILELTEAPGNSARLWENRTAAAGRHFLRVQLEGLPPNTEAAGARIFARIGNTEQMREIVIGSNYTSQNPTVQIFGLGTSTTVDTLRVEWPAIDSGAGPVQPPATILTTIAASEPGETLSIRHPDRSPP
jgi:hypothetical protein